MHKKPFQKSLHYSQYVTCLKANGLTCLQAKKTYHPNKEYLGQPATEAAQKSGLLSVFQR